VPGNAVTRANDAIEGHSGNGFKRGHVRRQAITGKCPNQGCFAACQSIGGV
jgi:hypothetical protein